MRYSSVATARFALFVGSVATAIEAASNCCNINDSDAQLIQKWPAASPAWSTFLDTFLTSSSASTSGGLGGLATRAATSTSSCSTEFTTWHLSAMTKKSLPGYPSMEIGFAIKCNTSACCPDSLFLISDTVGGGGSAPANPTAQTASAVSCIDGAICATGSSGGGAAIPH